MKHTKLLIMGALHAEIVGVAEQVAASYSPAAVVACGVGPLRAARTARLHIETHDPQALLIVGSCGALDSAIPIGTVVVADEVMADEVIADEVMANAYVNADAAKSGTSGDMSIQGTSSHQLRSSAGLRDAMVSAARRLPTEVIAGRLLTWPVPVADSSLREELHRRYAAVAVDMESMAIATVAVQQGIPWAAARVVVDLADERLGHNPDRAIRAALTARTLAGLVGVMPPLESTWGSAG